jgi:hypothetical protein
MLLNLEFKRLLLEHTKGSWIVLFKLCVKRVLVLFLKALAQLCSVLSR